MHDSLPVHRRAWPAPLAGLCLFALALPAAAQTDRLRDLVEEVLDQQAQSVEISDLPIREALSRLGDQSGLRFTLDEAVVNWMPYGERTRVSIDLKGVTLREGLQRLFDGLGLAMRVAGDKVRIEPAPVLERLGRRMTIKEVHLLHSLARKPWSQLAAESPPLLFSDVEQANPRRALADAIAQVRAPNALRQIEAATQRLGWRWAPQEDAVVIYSRAAEIRHRLQRPVDLNYQSVPLDDLLIDLGNRVGITVSFQPGVLQRIAARQRAVELIHRGTTVLQTLERLCGTTGTSFTVTDHGVLIAMPEGQELTPRSPKARIVAVLRVPVGDDGTTIEFPFYEDNLPPEFAHLLERKLPEVIEELRRRAGR